MKTCKDYISMALDDVIVLCFAEEEVGCSHIAWHSKRSLSLHFSSYQRFSFLYRLFNYTEISIVFSQTLRISFEKDRKLLGKFKLLPIGTGMCGCQCTQTRLSQGSSFVFERKKMRLEKK